MGELCIATQIKSSDIKMCDFISTEIGHCRIGNQLIMHIDNNLLC